MSTKAIREFIEHYVSSAEPGSIVAERKRVALAEVEAIEKAAKEFSDPAQGMSAASMGLLESIAKDAP